MYQNYLYTKYIFCNLKKLQCHDKHLCKIWNPPRYVCEAVSRRASMMASAGVTALLKKMDYKVRIQRIRKNLDTKILPRTLWSPSTAPFSDSTPTSRMWCNPESLSWWASTSSSTSSFQRWALSLSSFHICLETTFNFYRSCIAGSMSFAFITFIFRTDLAEEPPWLQQS